jgi:hypothetical protein
MHTSATGKSVPVAYDGGAVAIPCDDRPESVTGIPGDGMMKSAGASQTGSIPARVTRVGGAEGERIRGNLAAVLAELLTWAGERAEPGSREERKAASPHRMTRRATRLPPE